MNPHARLPASASSLLSSLWTHRRLIVQMTRREVIGRYRGSVIGLAWSFFNPLLMLVVYTFVFGVVFKARWGTTGDESRAKFALVLFAGLIVHGLLAECLVRAPELIVSQVNYVKKVVFPLEILPVVIALSAAFHALISALALLLAMAVVNEPVPWTAPLLPLVLAPLAIGGLGLCWILASLGVFVRDIAQTIGIAVTVLMFVSPGLLSGLGAAGGFPSVGRGEPADVLYGASPQRGDLERAAGLVDAGPARCRFAGPRVDRLLVVPADPQGLQ